MSQIEYDLTRGSFMNGMAPQALPAGNFTHATLPFTMNMAGIYIIWNSLTSNRYVGVSQNIRGRFNTRLATVTEMGFSAAQMGAIVVFWGRIRTRNTPTAQNSAPPWQTVLNYSAPLNWSIDGYTVNLERLLIRFILTQAGFGGTVSNNMLAFGGFPNPTPYNVSVTLRWAAPLAQSHRTAVWQQGGPPW